MRFHLNLTHPPSLINDIIQKDCKFYGEEKVNYLWSPCLYDSLSLLSRCYSGNVNRHSWRKYRLNYRRPNDFYRLLDKHNWVWSWYLKTRYIINSTLILKLLKEIKSLNELHDPKTKTKKTKNEIFFFFFCLSLGIRRGSRKTPLFPSFIPLIRTLPLKILHDGITLRNIQPIRLPYVCVRHHKDVKKRMKH